VSAERMVFGEFADRPVVDRSRAAAPANDEAEGEESEVEAPVAGEGV
jgi:hypothetical protein